MLLTFYVNIDGVVDCIQHKVLVHTLCLMADPLLSITGRGGNSGGLLITGMFMLNCGHEYSVIV